MTEDFMARKKNLTRREAIVTTGAIAAGLWTAKSMAQPGGDDKNDDGKHTTIITSGIVKRQTSARDSSVIEILFTKANATWNADENHRKLIVPAGTQIRTNGAVVESKGPTGSVIEIIGLGELKKRFPKIVKENPNLERAYGLCILTGPPYNCDKGTCTGSCTLHNIPVYCSCD
jgi:hypothetical protein